MKSIIRCGEHRTEMIEFNDQTTVAEVSGQIDNSFFLELPSEFHVEFYSFKARKNLTLDEDLLNSEYNPFRCNSTNKQSISIADCQQFVIIDDSTEDSQSTTVMDEFSASDLNDALVDTTSSDELSGVLLASSFLPNTVISQNNIASNDTDVDEDTAVENSSGSQSSNTSSTDYRLATETTDATEAPSDRITFSFDVHPEQKHHYLTNKFSIDDDSNGNGGISLIQGWKTPEQIQKRIKMLPHLFIPRLFRRMTEVLLFIYAVYEEEQNDGTRIWYKHPHKGFLLPDQLNANAGFFNPIQLILNETHWKENGDYPLEMYLLTKRDKTFKKRDEEEIYQLDKIASGRIHTAEHVECSSRTHIKPTRLLCVPKVDNQFWWSSFGLSDFIQPPNKTTVAVPLSTYITVPSAIPIANMNLNLNVITAVTMISPPSKRRRL